MNIKLRNWFSLTLFCYWFSILVFVLLFDFSKIPGMSRKSKKNTVWIHFVLRLTQITHFLRFLSPWVYAAQTVSSSSYRNDFSGWNLLCQAIDRVLFISYLAIILIFIASYLRRTALASQSWKHHGLTVYHELNSLFKKFSVVLLWMCLFWNVPFSECALSGMCPFWNMLFLGCALFGMCPFRNVLFLECAFLEFASSGQVKLSNTSMMF